MYPFKDIENKWQTYWEKNKTFQVPKDIDKSKPKYYVLDMFPYPSGDGLHVGHPEGYTASDIIARYKRMQGFNVLHPMGWDAFGLPAEQYAIKTGTHPKITTEKNINRFKKQLKSFGFSYDWDLEINTTDPDYYKWTQWIFLQMFKKNLAYQSNMPVWWCEQLGTTLANEEVIDGLSEVGGFQCERKPLKQWMLKITNYAEKLLEGLDSLDWPLSTIEMQKNWIGKSIGAEINFKVEKSDEIISIFTTRPDTIFGATYIVLSPEHELVTQITKDEFKLDIEKYINLSAKKSDLERTAQTKEKSGAFTGSYAINPVSKKLIPIWIADYVLAHYGTGAIMAVPGEDQRDWEFAVQYDLEIIRTVQPPSEFDGEAYTGDGNSINSDFLDGLNIEDSKKKIIEYIESNNIGNQKINYKLRDWLFSRQRYWGEPFPILFDNDTIIPIDEGELPITLPELEDFKPSGSPEGPLIKAKDWLKVRKGSKELSRETNTMPQWAGSCWYYLRYIDPNNHTQLIDKELEEYWMPVDLYVGGSEHAVLHLLYARFWHKFLYDIGITSTQEPFKKLVHQGMILGEAEYYAYQTGGKFISSKNIKDTQETQELKQIKINEADVIEKDGFYFLRDNLNIQLELKSSKMSKSRGNVVNPDEIVSKYGADAFRLYEMFMGPLEQVKPWSTSGVEGTYRFLNRVWNLFIDSENSSIKTHIHDNEGEESEKRILAKVTKKVTSDIEAFRFNTAISSLMEALNALYKLDSISVNTVENFLLLLSPLAPHISEEIWNRLGHARTLAYESWPIADSQYLIEDAYELPIQVNGKVRGKLTFSIDQDKDTVITLAKEEPSIAKYISGSEIVKTIYVEKRILNFVTKK